MRKILVMIFLISLLGGCTQAKDPTVTKPSKPTQQEAAMPTTIPGSPGTVFTETIYAEAQLLGEAESREKAEELAELYGITLVEYKNRLARFHTDEDPREVIRRGKDNGWPELVLNRVTPLS